jgi:hypothetical protein
VEEGRQIEAGTPAQPSEKVVRLPRDWLGPREHLVPFGSQTPPSAEPVPAAGPAPEEFAPTADDFWGERSIAFHAVVPAPDDQRPGDTPDTRPQPPASKPRPGRRRLAAAAALGIAAVGAIALLLSGSPHRVVGGARLNIAAILNSGVSMLKGLDPPRIVASAAPRTVKHVPHGRPRPKGRTASPRHHTSPPPASTYVAHPTPSHAHATYHASALPLVPQVRTSAPPTRPSTSSGATVTPTGQYGALGPVQSTNG